jgi:hypothetical protein
LQLDGQSVYINLSANLDMEMELMWFGAWKWHRFTFIESGFLRVHLYLSNSFLQSVVLNSINLEGQGRQPPLATAQPPATSHQLYAASRQPPAAFTLEG